MELCQKNEDMDVVQSAVYGLGVIASRYKKADFKHIKTEILNIISAIITHPEANSEDRIIATENAIGTLGTLAIFQGEAGDKISQEILMRFLQYLPLKHDSEQAQKTHYMVLENIINKNEMLTLNNVEIQNQLLKVVNDFKSIESNNPEIEILDDKGKLLLNQMLQMINV